MTPHPYSVNCLNKISLLHHVWCRSIMRVLSGVSRYVCMPYLPGTDCYVTHRHHRALGLFTPTSPVKPLCRPTLPRTPRSTLARNASHATGLTVSPNITSQGTCFHTREPGIMTLHSRVRGISHPSHENLQWPQFLDISMGKEFENT